MIFKVPSNLYHSVLHGVMGLRGKALVAGGAIGVASVRSCEKLPPSLIKPVPANSKTDPLLPKTKPISNSGSDSVITYLRKGRKKKLCGETAVRVRQCERNNSAYTKVGEEGEGRRCPKCRSREPSLATHDEDHGEAGCSPAVHGGPQWSRSPPIARGRHPTPDQVDA